MDRITAKATLEGTLNYIYDAAGNVASIVSSNPNGVSLSYTYDNVGRLSTVVDNRLTGSNTTTYSYDPASNLATAVYPNQSQSQPFTFTYDTLNRLTALSTPVSSYTYQLGAVGNRTINGRCAKLPSVRLAASIAAARSSFDSNVRNGTRFRTSFKKCRCSEVSFR
jgi:YD repeat-containing protein